MLYCIFCDSLEVSESFDPHNQSYSYFCHDCDEHWLDDESEMENMV